MNGAGGISHAESMTGVCVEIEERARFDEMLLSQEDLDAPSPTHVLREKSLECPAQSVECPAQSIGCPESSVKCRSRRSIESWGNEVMSSEDESIVGKEKALAESWQ